MSEDGPLSTELSDIGGDAGRLTSGLSVRQPLEGPFRPSLPFVLSEYLTAEERRQEKMRRKFEVNWMQAQGAKGAVVVDSNLQAIFFPFAVL